MSFFSNMYNNTPFCSFLFLVMTLLEAIQKLVLYLNLHIYNSRSQQVILRVKYSYRSILICLFRPYSVVVDGATIIWHLNDKVLLIQLVWTVTGTTSFKIQVSHSCNIQGNIWNYYLPQPYFPIIKGQTKINIRAFVAEH